MALQEIKQLGGTHIVAVGVDPTTGGYYPLPVNAVSGQIAVSSTPSAVADVLKAQDFVSWLALTKKVYTASAASAVNGTVTGQTSFVATTPTFLLSVPLGITAIPLLAALAQSGTVAGADINILMAKDYENRFSSGGTALQAIRDRDGLANPSCTMRSGATATADAGVVPTRMWGLQLGPDVSPAEGVINEAVWTPAGALDFIDGPGSWLIYTYAGTTGPTWLYEFKWAEIATSELP